MSPTTVSSSLQGEREEKVVRLGLEEGVAPAGQVGEAGHLTVVERPAADLLVRKRKLVQTPVFKFIRPILSRDH